MNPLNLSVRFELQPDATVAKAFVCDEYIGRVYFQSIKGETKLVFRCSQNPWRNFIRCEYPDLYETLEHALQERKIQENLIPVVIRNALVYRKFLANYNFETRQTDAYLFVHNAA